MSEDNSVAKSLNCRFFPKCGGCSYLHLPQDQYRQLKQNHLQKILRPLNFSNIEFEWIKAKSRRKITLQIDSKNNLGFFAKSSNDIVAIDSCFIAAEEISDLIIPLKNFIKTLEQNLITQISLTFFDNVIDIIFICKRELNITQITKITDFAKSFKINVSSQVESEINPIMIGQKNQILCGDYILDLDSEIFIQATKKGLQKISEIIFDHTKKISSLASSKKISVADIYSGFGAYSFLIARQVGEVNAFEGNTKMIQLIKKNAQKNSLSQVIKPQQRDLFLHPIDKRELDKLDLVIINPPRNGASPQIKKIAQSRLQNLIYVSCSLQSFVRDAAILLEAGFRVEKIVAIDQFYGSAHLEVVGVFCRE